MAFVIFAVFGRNRLNVRHEWTVPRALPAEAKRAEERHERLPDERFLELLPTGAKRRRLTPADEAGGVIAEHLVDGSVGEKLRRLNRDGIGPVRRSGRVRQSA